MSLSVKWLLATVYLAALSLCADNPPGTCYYPGLQLENGLGDVAKDYFPCDDTQYQAQCCPRGYTCFSNLLCVITDPRGSNSSAPIGTVKRASCTNARWQNTLCGNFCLDTANKLGAMSACGNDKYCCSADELAGTCSCATGIGTISIPQGTVQNVVSLAAPYQTSTTIPSSSNTPTSSSTETSTAITPQPTETEATVSKNKGAIIGGSVAGAVVFLLIIAALWFFFLKEDKTPYIPPEEGGQVLPEFRTSYAKNRDPKTPNIIIEPDR